jgi:hypothetical protein
MTYGEYLKDKNLTGKMYRDFLINKMRAAEKELEHIESNVPVEVALFYAEIHRYILDIMGKLYELDNGKSE